MSYYNRLDAIAYAKKWALRRNDKYFNFDSIGGDCTNYVSQCLYAGIGVMNYQKYGWYYNNGNDKAPAWTGVEHLYKFLINNKSDGPKGIDISISTLNIGDIIQLSFDGVIYGHTLIITELSDRVEEIKVCAHTIDSYNRKLGTYLYKKSRGIHIV